MEIKLQQPYKGKIVQILGNHWRTEYRGVLTYCAAPDKDKSAAWLSKLEIGSGVYFKATAPSTRTKGEFVGQLVSPGNVTPPKPIVWLEPDNARKRLLDWLRAHTNDGVKLKKRNGLFSLVTHEGLPLTEPMDLKMLIAATGFQLKPHERLRDLI